MICARAMILISLGVVLPFSETRLNADCKFMDGQDVCLKAPGYSPGDIWLRDSDGNLVGREWPDQTLAEISRSSSNCKLYQAKLGEDEAWVSHVVVQAASICQEDPGDPGDDDQVLCGKDGDCLSWAKRFAKQGKVYIGIDPILWTPFLCGFG